MTLQELEHIFRFQTTATEDYIPTGRIEYILFEGRNQTPGHRDVKDMDGLISTLEGYVLEGYRDKTPLFIRPEVEL
jgi:hypothetical protein